MTKRFCDRCDEEMDQGFTAVDFPSEKVDLCSDCSDKLRRWISCQSDPEVVAAVAAGIQRSELEAHHYTRIGSFTDAVETKREFDIRVVSGTIQFKIRGGRVEYPAVFMLTSEDVDGFISFLQMARAEVPKNAEFFGVTR